MHSEFGHGLHHRQLFFALATKSGYSFVSAGFSGSGGTNDSVCGSSAPVAFNQTGVRNFCIVTDGVLRSNPGAAGGAPAADVATCQAYATAQ